MPPKAFMFEVGWGWGGAAGFEAYSDNIDCLRSVLPGTPGIVGPVLDGLAGGADCAPPKKSSPSKLSFGLVCFGGAAGALGGAGRLNDGSVVLGRTGWGVGSVGSPKRSISGCLALGGCGSAAELALPFLVVPLLARARSCTTFKGTSSSSVPSSSAAGSGIGPSITHLRESYFVRMKFSILDSLGTCPSASLCSQYLFALLLPHFIIELSCSSVHESRSTDLTLEICTPSER